MIRVEMEVDDVKSSQKGKDQCVLITGKDSVIMGYAADIKVTISCSDVMLFEDMNIPNKGNLIDIEFTDPSQTQLPSGDEE